MSATLIPEKEESGAGSVYVVQEGKARRRSIQVNGTQQDRLWIGQGLKEGELVVEEIGPALKDGAAVRALPRNSNAVY